MLWEALLDQIRLGETPIEISGSGLPRLFESAPYYEQKQFVAALAAGYLRNYNKVQSLKNVVRREMGET